MGGVAGLILIGLAIWFWRRRTIARRSQLRKNSTSVTAYQQITGWRTGESEDNLHKNKFTEPVEADSNMQLAELHGFPKAATERSGVAELQ